ncbi:MAG: hypothetical protein F7C07_04715 [Desulfurococcales archaeon]|nr:hypothetical protein [Desulfurococcales archaeon]
MPGEEKRREPWREDVEELREVLTAISDFLSSLKEPVRELLSAIVGPIEGGKLGREIGDFYRGLKESGVPEEMAVQMTREYFRKRLESLPSVASFVDALKEAIRGGVPGARVAVKTGEKREDMESGNDKGDREG